MLCVTYNVYRRIWLISARAYNSKWKGNMRLINDMRLYIRNHTHKYLGVPTSESRLRSNSTVAAKPTLSVELYKC